MTEKTNISLRKLYWDLRAKGWGEEECLAILHAVNNDPEINPIEPYGE